MYSITEGFSPILCCRPDIITLGNPFDTRVPEGFSPILCCRPDVITLGNPFDTRVPDYSSSFFFFFFLNEEEAIPPGGKKHLGTIKASTRMILVHVQKMYKTCTEDVQYI